MNSAPPTRVIHLLTRNATTSLADGHVARELCDLAGVEDDWIEVAAALCCRAPRQGHVCLELASMAPLLAPILRELGIRRDAPTTTADWRAIVVGSPLVEVWSSERESTSPDLRPLVLVDDRLYLRRYHTYEHDLAGRVTRLAALERPGVDSSVVQTHLRALFGDAAEDEASLDRQAMAALVSVHRRLTIVCGGPGTGKTTTVVKILALHAHLAADAGRAPPRIALAAPTGKAAARLAESIQEGLSRLDLPSDISDCIQQAPTATLHRLLGIGYSNPTAPRHHPDHPLPHDTIVLDEASMVSLPGMARLFAALRHDASIVLLGDRNQLASVEAGAVLGDMCSRLDPERMQHGRAFALSLHGSIPESGPIDLEALARERVEVDDDGVWNCIVPLTRFHRFRGDGGIGRLARHIAACERDPDTAISTIHAELAAAPRDGELRWSDAGKTGSRRAARADARVLELAARGYGDYLESLACVPPDPERSLESLSRLRVLCATREGQLGTKALNRRIEAELARRDPNFAAIQTGRSSGSDWYPGRPVLVRDNDHGLGIYNGDVGVTLADDEGRLSVHFPPQTPGGDPRAIPVVRLPRCETVFAMTIHKSQGSQFDHVIVILPRSPTPILTRELIYTACTRARSRLSIMARREIFDLGLRTPVRRATGLGQALWEGDATS